MNVIYDAILGKLRFGDTGSGGGSGSAVSRYEIPSHGTSLPDNVTYDDLVSEIDGGVVVELTLEGTVYNLIRINEGSLLFQNVNEKCCIGAIVYSDSSISWTRYDFADEDYVNGRTVKRVSEMPSAAASLSGDVYLFTGATAGNYTTGHFYLCSGSNNSYSWSDITPTEETNIVKSADTLPTAAASLVGAVYLYTGTTTASYTHGHFYRCAAATGGTFEWIDAQVGSVRVGNCASIRCITQGTTVKLKWRDPDDLVVDGVTISRWKKTVVVRKQGSYPTSPEDGTVVVTNTVRNQYATSAYTDTTSDSTITWYYQFFPYSVEDMITVDDANRTLTGELTWNTVRDIVRSGEASSYFAAGDTLTEAIYNMGITSTSQYDLEVLGIDKMTAADTAFTRSSTNDSGSAYAWKDGDNELVYTASATPSAADTAYLDAAMTIATATVSSMSGTTMYAARIHSLTLGFKQCTDGTQFDAAEKQYALTEDTAFHPEYILSINIGGAATATKFVIVDKTKTGTERVWYSVNGAYKLYYITARSRWEIWSMNSGTHIVTGADAQDYQSTANAEPTGGTWFKNSVFAEANTYYHIVDDAYVAAVAGTDFTAGDAIPANTYYELNPTYGQRQYGYNRWRDSGLRQYLNSTGTNWWTAKHIWDNAPSYASSHGFLDRLPSALLAVIGYTKLITAVNTTDSCGGSDVTEDRLFLLAHNEVGGSSVNGITEGATLDRYIGAEAGDRIKYYLNGTATNWWLRSPYSGNAHHVYYVNATGVLADHYAYHGYGCAPACNII